MSIFAKPKTVKPLIPKVLRFGPDKNLTRYKGARSNATSSLPRVSTKARSKYRLASPSKPIFVGVRNRKRNIFIPAFWHSPKKSTQRNVFLKTLRRLTNFHVQTWFLSASQSKEIDYSKLEPLVRRVFPSTRRPWHNVQLLLEGHEHLMENPVADIAIALQRHLDEKPPRVHKPAEVILDYDTLVKQGARDSTWKNMVDFLRLGGTIASPKAYAVSGHFSAHSAIVRPLNDKALVTLPNHKLIATVSEWAQILAFDPTSLVLDLLEEEKIPLKFRRAILEIIDLQYSFETGTLTDSKDQEVTLIASSPTFPRVIEKLIELIGNSHLAIGEVQKALGEHLSVLLVVYLRDSFAHFQEHFDGVMQHISNLEGMRYDTPENIPADAKSLLTETLRGIYLSAHELIVSGLPDYALPNELITVVRNFILDLFPDIAEVRAKVTEWGVEIPEDLTQLQSSIDKRLANLDQRIPQLFRNKKIEEARRLSKQRKFLGQIDMKTRDAIESSRTWSDLLQATAPAFERIPLALANLVNTWKTLHTQLVSFGKFFSLQSLKGKPIEIHMLPVKGLPAAVAVDTGSDCGDGRATGRAVIDEYMIAAITDRSHTKSWGYHGQYDVIADGALWCMTCALNPSTTLDINGGDFVAGTRGHLQTIRATAKAVGITIHGFLAAASSHDFSNRQALRLVHPTGPSIKLPEPIITIPKEIDLADHIVPAKTKEVPKVDPDASRSPYDILFQIFKSHRSLWSLIRSLQRLGDEVRFVIDELEGSIHDYHRREAAELRADSDGLWDCLNAYYDISRASTPQEMESAFVKLLGDTDGIVSDEVKDRKWWTEDNVARLFDFDILRRSINSLYHEGLEGSEIEAAEKAVISFGVFIQDQFEDTEEDVDFDADLHYELRQSNPENAIYFTEPE